MMGGYCWAKFKTEEGFNLEMLITRYTSYNNQYTDLGSFFSSSNFDLSKLSPYGDYAGYSQVGPLNVDNHTISTGLSGSWSIKVVLSREKNYNYAGARIVKPSYMIIGPENVSEFWKLVDEVEMEGKTRNGVQWGANICKLVLWF